MVAVAPASTRTSDGAVPPRSPSSLIVRPAPSTTYPSLANCSAIASTSSPSVTVLARPVKIDMPAIQLWLKLPVSLVQLLRALFQVSAPPAIRPSPTLPVPSQKFTARPGCLAIRLTCPRHAVCTSTSPGA